MAVDRSERLNKAEFAALDALMGQEVGSALTGKFLPHLARIPKRTAERLVERGLIEATTFEVSRDRFGKIEVSGWVMTHLGGMVYGKACAELPEANE